MRSISVLALLACAVVLAAQQAARSAEVTHECGLPDARPLWIDYGEGSVPPEVRAVFARPGVVVAASGTSLPKDYRAKGAATTYFVLSLPGLVGEPAKPADPAAIEPTADALFDRAVASTGCTTPWIALNELAAPQAATPWTPTNAQYRANVLALLQRLAARGAHPALFIHGDPNVAGDAAAWWRSVGAVADVVYEAYYNAVNIDRLGPLLGPRRVRVGMRSIVNRFTGVGIAAERLGLALGFQVAPGAAGREGLQPREEWFRFVKWNALAARQVTSDDRTSTIWSWGVGDVRPGERRSGQAGRSLRLSLDTRFVAVRRPGRRRTRVQHLALRGADRAAGRHPLRLPGRSVPDLGCRGADRAHPR